MAEKIKMLFGVNTPRGPWNIVLDVGPDSPTESERGPVLNFGTPHIYGTAEARDLTFREHIEGGGPNENYAKVGHRRSW